MKTTSWEIIIAGFLFVGISIFLIEHNSDSSTPNQNSLNSDSLEVKSEEKNIHVFKLHSLENLENLKELENLKSLQNLENLKNLKTLLPMEIRAEFESEIDQVIKEMDQESLEVNFDVEKKTLTIDPESLNNLQGWTAKSPGVYLFTRTFDSSNSGKTALSLPFGSVEVEGNSNGSKNLFIEASGNISSLNDLRTMLATESSVNDEQASFRLISKSERSDDQNIQIQSKLEVPRNMQLDIHTLAGHIVSDNIEGTQTYQTNGGHITLNNIAGIINAETGGGHIQIKDSDGQVNLISKGGNIRVQELTGDLILQTGGGSLQIMEHIGAIKASTNGGNIEIRSSSLNGPINANTGAGSITLWMNKDANIDLDLSGSNVEIDSEFNFNGTLQNGNASGTIGTGEYKLTAKTNYGTVSIKAIN